jgi:hypothetical protein
MAAVDDPWSLDTELRQLIAAHQDILDRQPRDRHHELDHAARQLATDRKSLDAAQAALDEARGALDEVGLFAPLTRRGRTERRTLEHQLSDRQAAVIAAAGPVASAHAHVERLTREQNAHDRHEREHCWRRDEIDTLRGRLAQHWTDVALACVNADQTLAYGVEPLRIGRHHLADQLDAIEASLPADRSNDHGRARATLRAHTVARQAAELRLTHAQAELDEQLSRRWPRRDKTGIDRSTVEVQTARQQVAETRQVEVEARAHLADLSRHQQARAAALADTATERHALSHDLSRLETALEFTRSGRVMTLVERPTPLHIEVLGRPPVGAAGRAVWCHQAMRLEQHLDHGISAEAAWHSLINDLSATPTLARVADRHIANQARHRLGPADWATITEHATTIHAATIEHARPVTQHGHEIEFGL